MSKSPTIRLLLGLLFTLAAVMGFSWYALHQLHGLRKLQTDTIDINRHDSLLLLAVLNDVNTIGLKVRDMTQSSSRSRISAYRAEFDQIRADLQSTIGKEASLVPANRRADTQAELVKALQHFWRSSDLVFAAASVGREAAARRLASTRLFPEQARLAARVSALLELNNAAEENADQQVAKIYDGVKTDVYAFLTATMLAILVTSLYLIYSNRKIFEQIESLSSQRRFLAAKLITVQEEVLRSVSRELHDEFGQILTAVGAMLARAERKGVPSDSPLRTELSEVREITHSTLEKIRSLSQMLHPAVIDDYGLAKAVEWYTEIFQRQTGIQTKVVVHGIPIRIVGQSAIHCFRIIQEALNNAAKHSGSRSAEVEMIFAPETLMVSVRDSGQGMTQEKNPEKRGLGLIAMRERAELLGGQLEIYSMPNAGTAVTLSMPLQHDVRLAEVEGHQVRTNEIVSQRS
ncbi:MAG: sensor histidine kinase [Acidobacteriaceae bacterium]|nr:sensor histidine kinase [Acidobacteriaceae bacterium]